MHKFFLMFFAALMLSACGTESVDSMDTESYLRGGQACGGFAGLECDEGFECVDDRRDSCDPKLGGADCIGVCRKAKKDQCDHKPNQYVGNSLEECATIHFICAEGEQYFADDCGCGCEPAPVLEECGADVCAEGMVCCNASCGICTEPGGFCTQQACEPTTAG